MPANPAAGTSTFEPPPMTRTGMPRSWHRATTRLSASASTGSQKNLADPPIPSQV